MTVQLECFVESLQVFECSSVLPIVSYPDRFFPFLFGDGGKKGLVDLHRLFCSADPQMLGIVNRC